MHARGPVKTSNEKEMRTKLKAMYRNLQQKERASTNGVHELYSLLNPFKSICLHSLHVDDVVSCGFSFFVVVECLACFPDGCFEVASVTADVCIHL